MGTTPGEYAGLLVAAVALLAVRAVGAGLEAALVAVGRPRAQALAGAPGALGPVGAHVGARAGARALLALFADAEATAFTIRASATLATTFAGLLAGLAGAAFVPAAPWTAGAASALGVALLSLPLAAAARGLGASHGEVVALALAPAWRALGAVLRPLGLVVKWVAGPRARYALPPPPLDEMERALAEYARGSAGGEATTELIHAVFEFRDKVARDVMVPRTDVVAIDLDTPVPEILRLLAEEGHSRMPVFRETLDQIVGVLHARDLVPLLMHPELIVLRDVVRPAHFVPWSKPVERLLREMQRRRLHMAFVVDEHGGIMGLCTLEDVLEQIVGDIGDEFDEAEEGAKPVEAHPDGSFTVQGQTTVAEFNQAARADLPEDEGFETVGGFLNALAGAIPAKGDRIAWRGWVFTVADADPRKVTKVRAAPVKRP